MTKSQAKNLLPQTVVTWNNRVNGTVRIINSAGLIVDWVDQKISFIDYYHVDKLELYYQEQ